MRFGVTAPAFLSLTGCGLPLVRHCHCCASVSLSGSASAVSFIAGVLSGLSRIVQHYTTEPVRVSALSAGLLVDLALYICGLLLVSAARLTALDDGADYRLDEGLLLFSAETVSRICCALTADEQAALYKHLLPLLRDGTNDSLMAAFGAAAARLMNSDTDVVAEFIGGAMTSRSTAPVSLLSVAASPPVSCRQLLCVLCPAVSCYRPASVAAAAVEQSSLVERVVTFLCTPSAEAFNGNSRSAVLHFAACLTNKLPADSPLLASLIQSLLEQHALEALERMARDDDDAKQRLSSQGATDSLGQRVPVAACLLKALTLRSHPAATSLLTRYAQLPSLVPAAGGEHAKASHGLWPLLQRWSEGFTLLMSDFPLLLTRTSHARIVGAATLFRQRLLVSLLPTLQRQIEQRQQQRRQRAKQRLSQANGTDSHLVAGSADEATPAVAADGEVDQCLSCLLLAAMQLAVRVPSHVAAQCMEQLLPLTVASLAAQSAACQTAGLRTLHSFLSQQSSRQQRLWRHGSSPSPSAFVAIPSALRPAQLSEQLPTVVPVLLSLLIRQPAATASTSTAPRVADELRALDCLSALRSLPFSALYPFRSRVLTVLAECADREERAVRRQAIRVRNEWSSND